MLTWTIFAIKSGFKQITFLILKSYLLQVLTRTMADNDDGALLLYSCSLVLVYFIIILRYAISTSYILFELRISISNSRRLIFSCSIVCRHLHQLHHVEGPTSPGGASYSSIHPYTPHAILHVNFFKHFNNAVQWPLRLFIYYLLLLVTDDVKMTYVFFSLLLVSSS